MNFKLRFMNRATLIPIIVQTIALVYMILGAIGIVPGLSEEAAVNIAYAVVALLTMMGIIVDPTTEGITDSERAMGYDKPYSD